MKLSELENKLIHLLIPELFKDYCPNGLIVKAVEGDPDVTGVVTGVSLRNSLIDAAIEKGANVIFVHHPNGFWHSEKDKRILDNVNNYTRKLIQHGISLFGYHLPLDAHIDVGNNAQIYRKLKLSPDIDTALSGGYAPRTFMDNIGYIGTGVITHKLLGDTFTDYYACNFETGKEYKVAICSGSGTSGLQEAYELGCNMFITGEIRESTPIFAEEHNMAVIAAGHHRSEVFGVIAIADFLQHECNVNATFVNFDNPI